MTTRSGSILSPPRVKRARYNANTPQSRGIASAKAVLRKAETKFYDLNGVSLAAATASFGSIINDMPAGANVNSRVGSKIKVMRIEVRILTNQDSNVIRARLVMNKGSFSDVANMNRTESLDPNAYWTMAEVGSNIQQGGFITLVKTFPLGLTVSFGSGASPPMHNDILLYVQNGSSAAIEISSRVYFKDF